jgi:hypothetical protein
LVKRANVSKYKVQIEQTRARRVERFAFVWHVRVVYALIALLEYLKEVLAVRKLVVVELAFVYKQTLGLEKKSI